MSRLSIALLSTAIIAIAAIGGFFWWQHQHTPETTPPQVAQAPETPASAASQPQEAEAHYPIPETTPPQPLAALDKSDKQVTEALSALIGSKSVSAFLQTSGFIRRVVATVDNLGRSHAPPQMWPVNPTGGQFTTVGTPEHRSISADNALRYAPIVNLIEAVNMRHAAAVYVRFYPLFQQAYEELGYPKKYFNDRLVTVIDLLLAAPEPQGPVEVRLTEVKGPERQLRPWVHYEYTDPSLEDLESGQKIMIRLGLANERRVKVKLRELRAAVTNAKEELKASLEPAPASASAPAQAPSAAMAR